MRFALPDDAVAVADAMRNVLSSHCSPDIVRLAWSDDPEPRLAELWHALAELGLPALLVPQPAGGLGCDELFLVAAVEETGYAAVPEPVVETAAVAAPLLAELGDPLGVLPQVLAGDLRITARVGLAGPVPFAQVSDLLLLGRRGALRLASRGEVEVEPVATVDASRRAGWVGVGGAPLNATTEQIDHAFDLGALAAAAQLVGLAARMLDVTVDYVRGREQFGVPVGSFQAVKHALANALIAIEFARPAVLRAAASVATRDPDRSRHVSMAKAMASDAGMKVSRTSIQCHGAIGYTTEYDLHLFVKRAWALASDWGNSAWHTSRIARSLGAR